MGYIVILFICSNKPFLVVIVVRVVIDYNSKVKLAYESGCTWRMFEEQPSLSYGEFSGSVTEGCDAAQFTEKCIL